MMNQREETTIRLALIKAIDAALDKDDVFSELNFYKPPEIGEAMADAAMATLKAMELASQFTSQELKNDAIA